MECPAPGTVDELTWTEGSNRARNSARAAAGSLLHWAPGERHAVRAVEDALLLLLLAPWPGPGHPSTPEAVAARTTDR